MKVRIEIFEDNGTEKANAQFNGKHWKEYVTNFINSIDDTEPPSTVPSSEIPTQQPILQQVQQPAQSPIPQPVQQPTLQPPMQQQLQPQQVPTNPQLQYYPYPAMQQPIYYYPQPVEYQPQTPPQVNHQPLQQAVFPNNQPPQPQQYAAQPVATLQPQVQPQAQTYKPDVPLRNRINDATLTISERLELFLKYEYPHVWFTSQEIQGHYERVYGFIKLSTVSTYLSRMYRKNLLQRRGNRTQREYMYISDETEMAHADGITNPAGTGVMQ